MSTPKRDGRSQLERTRPLELEPARAKRIDPEKLWGNPEWRLEEKLDGWRFLLHFGRDLDRTYMTGRRVSKTTGTLSEKAMLLPELWVEAGELDYTVLDGEIMPPVGADFRNIASFVNADPETVRAAVSKHGPPTYHAFDVLFYDGKDVRENAMLKRRALLAAILSSICSHHGREPWGVPPHPLIKLVPQLDAEKKHYDEIVARRGEGVILKNICAAYGESGAWIKVKKTVTVDVVVTGFTDAKFGRTGRIHGQIGAARVSVYSSAGELLEIGKVSGMDDAIRRSMTDCPDQWLGKVVEVEAAGFAEERLWHPRFVRARADVDPLSCTYAKMRTDLGLSEEQRVVKGEQQCLPL